jgi:drug/metabolite transporter (DMT)-like permease
MFKRINKFSKINLGALAIMAAALLWSLDGLFLRPQFYVLSAPLLVFWEHFLGLIVLSPFLYIYRKQILTLRRKSWGALFWISIFGGLLGTIMITKAFFAAFAGEASFATVVILQKLQPIFALLMARLILKERLSKSFYLWAVIAVLASYVLAFAQDGFNLADFNWQESAALFAFLAAFAFGSSTVFGKRLANHLDYRAVAALRFGLTSILAFILISFNGDLLLSGDISSLQWKFLALIVLTSGAGALFIYYFGLRRVSASAATLLELFWPFSALALDYLVHGNYLNYVQILALVVLLIAFFRISALSKAKPLIFEAKVISGQGKGKSMGYPTANLDKDALDMPHGIYAVKIFVQDKKYYGLLHFGFKDLFRPDVSAEILIKDFSADIYQQTVKVEILAKVREVKHFKSVDELSLAIKDDLLALEKFN